MSQRRFKKLYEGQSDAHRRAWLQQRGRSQAVRLTSKQNIELKKWFTYWDRDHSGTVNPREIANALFSLNVLSAVQKEELDALIEAATDGEDANFRFDEFRTLMTYPKCGIAKTLLGVLEGDLFVDESSTMPFHLKVQAHKREKLIGGLMSKNGSMRKESERVLGIIEAQSFRRQKLAEREQAEAKRVDATPTQPESTETQQNEPMPSEPEQSTPPQRWGKVRGKYVKPKDLDSAETQMANVVKSAMKGRVDGPNAGVPIHSKALFKISNSSESKIMVPCFLLDGLHS